MLCMWNNSGRSNCPDLTFAHALVTMYGVSCVTHEIPADGYFNKTQVTHFI